MVCLFSPSPVTVITEDQSLYWVFYDLCTSAQFWFLILVTLIAAILPDLALYTLDNYEKKRDRIKDIEKKNEKEFRIKASKRKSSSKDMSKNSKQSSLNNRSKTAHINNGFLNDPFYVDQPILRTIPNNIAKNDVSSKHFRNFLK